MKEDLFTALALVCCGLALVILGSILCQIFGSAFGLHFIEKGVIERGGKIFFVLAILAGLFFYLSRPTKNPSIK